MPICLHMVSQVVHLVRSQITEREALSVMATSQGMGRWLEDLGRACSEFDNWDCEDNEFFLADLRDDLEEQGSIIAYCLDALVDVQAGDYVS